MSYVVLARKWRPQSFADVVGQQHVSRTLSGAFASDRVAHAFLFTGVRGVGKTTCARVLAKALNCEKGASAEPCNQCPQCLEIAEGTDVDVQEIDGASYTGVDEVRRLQESLPYQPARDRFKVFIVDEVHMLSQNAWNAFLKTLEEPPPHVKFIFATTEVTKVPVTILSRCQRYDFKLIGVDDIAAHLQMVLAREQVAADDAAVRIIAREAAGSMRDAMSLLDQVIAWVGGSDEQLTADGVARVLGVAARSVLHQLGTALVDGDAATCLAIVSDLAKQGFGLQHVARDFLSHLRDLVAAKVSDEPERLLDLADSERADVIALAKRCDGDDLSRLYLGFSRSFDDIVRSAQPRGAFEMALVRLSQRPPLLQLDELLRRLADLERRLGGAPGGEPGPKGGPRATGGGRAPGPGGGKGPSAAPRAETSQGQAAEPRGLAKSAPVAPVPAKPARDEGPTPKPTPEPRPEKVASQAKPSPVEPSPPRASGGPYATPEPADLDHWRAMVAKLAADKPRVASIYEHAAPLSVKPGRVVLGFEARSFIAEQAAEAEARSQMQRAASDHFGAPTEIELDMGSAHPAVQTLAAQHREEQAARLAAAREQVASHPLVKDAIEVLGAELQDVRLPSEPS
jgi:DNA polymerase-3 subunit gamma/tau